MEARLPGPGRLGQVRAPAEDVPGDPRGVRQLPPGRGLPRHRGLLLGAVHRQVADQQPGHRHHLRHAQRLLRGLPVPEAVQLRAGDHDGAGPRGEEVHHGDAAEQPPAPQDQLHLQRGAQVRSLQDQEGGRAGQVLLQRCCWGDGRLRFSF